MRKQLMTTCYSWLYHFFQVASNTFSLYMISQFHHGVSSIRLMLFTPAETGVLMTILHLS